MAILPCSIGKHRYKGKAAHVYIALLNGGEAQRSHLRLCPPHAESTLSHFSDFLVTGEPDEDMSRHASVRCSSCGQPNGGVLQTAFVTAYPDGSDREDYYMVLHRDCRLPPFLEPLLGI